MPDTADESTLHEFGTSSFQFTEPATTAENYDSPRNSQTIQSTSLQHAGRQQRRKTSNKAGPKERQHEHYVTRLLTDKGNRPPLLHDDLDQPALFAFNRDLLAIFNNTLDSDTITTYDLCNER